ncbi:protein kinase [Paracoccus sp. N5]|uniref:protein kinase domain-containing protein n=1 Tax=Paracoccus sp. N5 TaxID=1101189 RepID=UPI0003A394B5|nr:protein kinase [Paracoccus sp. N5]
MPYDPQQPNLKRLKKSYSEASRRTVFFVGAGSSSEVGLPSWQSLAKGLLSSLDASTPSSALSGELLDHFNSAQQFYENGQFWELFGCVGSNWKQLYEDYLEDIFSHDRITQCEIPSVYRRIWRMRNVGQALTLNIDGLLSRAYNEVFGQNAPQLFEFPGTSVVDSRSYFSRNYPVVLNLHGIYNQRTTWVMNLGERQRLFTSMRGGAYSTFLRHIFENYIIVFVGVNIRDAAISPVIEEISKSGLLQDHYWLTPNINSDNYAWAQRMGVRTISYSPEMSGSGNYAHSTVICSILDEIESFKSLDQPAILPSRKEFSERDFPSAHEIIHLATTDPLGARAKLDQRIEYLGQQHGFNGNQIAGFVREYAIPIELTSIVGNTAPYSKLDRVSISTGVSSSNSSNVWLALEEDGSTMCAVKTLSAQAYKDPIERESFRRGIESLYQLNKTNQSIAPKFLFHTNIPLSVGMENINGTSLSEMVSSSPNIIRECWLETFIKISRSLMVCHSSEATVLHRDLKPKNILLEGAYAGCDAIDFQNAAIRFINFDMSWHKLSVGNTKSVSADEVGYYAPEQRSFQNSDTPRSTKTDIYMLGMVLLYLISEAPPPEGGAKLQGWEEYLRRKVGSRLHDELIRSRIARLLLRMTKVDPEHRPDLRSVVTDLEVIVLAEKEQWGAVDPDILVEKSLAMIGYDYSWDERDLKGIVKTPRQIELSLSYQHRGQQICLNWMRQRDDGIDRKNFGGKLGDLSSNVKQQLRDFGWEVEEGGGHHSRSIAARIKHKLIVDDANGFFNHTKDIVTRLMGDI